MHAARGEGRTALEIGKQMVDLTQNDPDIRRRMVAHRAVVTPSHQLCDFAQVLDHTEQVMALHQAEPQRLPLVGMRQDPVMACLSFAANALWSLGYADQARRRSREALTWARELSHPFSLASALLFAAPFHVHLQEGAIAHELAEEAIALATQHDFEEIIERSKQVNNCVLLMQGHVAECLEPMRQHLDYLRRKERKSGQPAAMLQLALAYGKSEEIGKGLRLVSEALGNVPLHQQDTIVHLVVTPSHQLCDFAQVLDHTEQVMALHQAEPQRLPLVGMRQDPVMACLSFAANALWSLGYADQARRRSREALTWARELSHPFSLASALLFAAPFHVHLQEGAIAHELAEEAIALATQHDFEEIIERSKQVNNCVLLMQGHVAECLEPMRQHLDYLRRKERKSGQPAAMLQLALAYGKSEEIGKGLRLVSEALAVIDELELHRFEIEAHRLRGELLLMAEGGWQHEALSSEDCFQQALDVARRQQAKSWELRAATSLARLWQQQDKRQEARELLAPVYKWFTEGFDTADLKEAKGLLDALS